MFTSVQVDHGGLLKIVDCSIFDVWLSIKFGQKIWFDKKYWITTKVLHIYMETSEVSSSVLDIHGSECYIFMAITVHSCLWKDSYISKASEGGIVNALFHNCTFVSILKETDVGIEFVGAFLVTVRNSSIQSYGKMCSNGCSIYMSGSDKIKRDIQKLKELAGFLACPLLECDFTNSKLLIEDTVITGSIYAAGSVVFSKYAVFEMTNCTFNMTTVSERGGIIYSISPAIRHYFKMTNTAVIGTSLRNPTPIISVAHTRTEIENVFILCSQSLHVFETYTYPSKLYKCQFNCLKEYYTLLAGYMTIKKEKYHWLRGSNSTIHSAEIPCVSCPVGAYCDHQIIALPNYWGYKMKDQNIISMIRCPENYCCSGNLTCNLINSCNTGRIGTLCGICEHNLTESLFSSKCIPQESCYSHAIFILYFTLVLIYGIGLLIFIFLKDKCRDIGKYIWKMVKIQLFQRRAQRLTGLGSRKFKIAEVDDTELHEITEKLDIAQLTNMEINSDLEPKPVFTPYPMTVYTCL